MESLGVISNVEQSNSWCVGMVAVPKQSGSIRICVELKPLNLSMQRQTYPLPTVEEILSKLSRANYISKLNANSGFWQIPLSPSSRHLTTFMEGFVCLIDDIFMFAGTEKEHDKRLKAVLDRIASAGATLNPEKCSFQQTELKFLGHVLNGNGVSPDPEKTQAIANMPAPDKVHGLHRFLGMVNQL